MRLSPRIRLAFCICTSLVLALCALTILGAPARADEFEMCCTATGGNCGAQNTVCCPPQTGEMQCYKAFTTYNSLYVNYCWAATECPDSEAR